MMRPCNSAQAPPNVLAPGAGGRTEVHHHVAGTDQAQGFIDLLELVGGARTEALLLRQAHIRIVDVLVEPGLVDLLALGFDFDAHRKSV